MNGLRLVGPVRWVVLGMALAAAGSLVGPRPSRAAPAVPTWQQAEELLRQQRWTEAHDLLDHALQREGSDAEERARLRLVLARFFRDAVDHPSETLRQLALAERELGPDHPLHRRAREERLRLEARERYWQSQNGLVDQSRLLPTEREAAPQRHTELLRLLDQHPDYPHQARVRYQLATLAQLMGRLAEAQDQLRQALSLRPALDFFLPASQLLDEVRQLWLKQTVLAWARGGLGLLLLLGGTFFLVARPWLRLRLRDLAQLALLGAVLAAGLLITILLLARTGPPPEESFPTPIFFFTGVDPVGRRELLGPLLAYAGAGLAGTLLLALALAPWRRRWLAALAGGCGAGVMWSGLVALFWVGHLAPHGLYVPAATGKSAEGAFYLLLPDPEPYILTRPELFAGLRIDGVDEPLFIEWLEQHIPGGGTMAAPPATEVGDAP